ncbi:MAG TPA: hypothetical protein VFQ53_00440 [Kofleriaceae bacterium]|nr:hypothetical protein [Kofleriaceae bacterium]
MTDALAVRIARYALPIGVLALVVCGPLLWFVPRIPVPDAASAKPLLRFTYAIAVAAWALQLQLAGGIAPIVRAVAAREAPSQLGALWLGLAGLVRAVLPTALVVAAIAIGALALVVPALCLVVLLALATASPAAGLPAPLVDSIRVVRAHLRPIAIVVAAIVIVDVGLAVAAQLAIGPALSKKPTVAELGAFRELARVVAIGVAIVSPFAATVLAALRARYD